MIPNAYLNEWRQTVPWSQDTMVEQDLIISRLLVELFSNPLIASSLAFRGGTAIYKLFTPNPVRYSEDIDLVQIEAKPIGETLTAIRKIVDPILGNPKRKLSRNMVTLTYNIISEYNSAPQKLKIEINAREHFAILGWHEKEFFINSRYFTGRANIISYHFNELLGTKIRAFYERDKGRDLFDLWYALQREDFNPETAVSVFLEYAKKENKNITLAMFAVNFSEKLQSGSFVQDITPLLAPQINWDPENAAAEVYEKIISLLPGRE